MSDAIYQPCPICKSPVNIVNISLGIDGRYLNCYRCGIFKLEQDAYFKIGDLRDEQIANISGWIYEYQKEVITTEKLQLLKDLKTISVGEKAVKLLKYIAKERPTPGQWIQIDFQSIYNLKTLKKNTKYPKEVFIKLEKTLPFLSITWARDDNELRYIINDYLIQEQGYLTGEKRYKITPKGWAYLDKIRNVNPHNEIVFIASKYEKEINEYLDNYVVTVLEELRYKPKLMRSHPHTNIIDNEMISLIKQSKFVIVDLTKNSLGAYYEAGYAQGFGLEVVYICEKSFRENKKNEKSKGVHFDTNHYPINDWEYDDGPGFKERLYHFIDVKFGKGTYNPK